MKEREFKEWLLANGFALSTAMKSVGYAKLIEKEGLDLDTAERDDIIHYLASKREEGMGSTSLNHRVRVINRYMKFRGREDLKMKFLREWQEETLIIMTDEEVKRILSVRWVEVGVDRRNRVMLEVLFATGVRINELINLDWSDLKYDNRARIWILKIRQGAKYGKPREVPIPRKVVEHLQEYKKYYRLPTHPSAIFTTPRGRISHAYARKVLTEAGEKAGVPYFHPHLARHWKAIKLLESGVDLETVRRILGHSSLKTTQIYLKYRDPGRMWESVKKDRFFGGY